MARNDADQLELISNATTGGSSK